MKTNNITDVMKILIFAATTMITCIIVAVGFGATKTAKYLSHNAMSQLTQLNEDLSDSDIKMYDKTNVTGSEVVNFIKKYLGDFKVGETAPIYVYIKTDKVEDGLINNVHISNIRDFSHSHYIKPTAKFYGEVDINLNGVISGVVFTQQ